MRTFLLSFLLLTLTQFINAQSRVGIKAGTSLFVLNSETVKQLDYDNPKLGVTVGLSYMLPINKTFSIQPEINYSFQNAQETYYNSHISLTYAQVPVLFQYKPGSGGVVLYAGPQVNFLTGAKIVGDNSTTTGRANFVQTDFGMGWGFGTRPAPNTSAKNITFDLRVYNGMTNVFKAVYDNGNKSRNTVLMLTLGYLFDKK